MWLILGLSSGFFFALQSMVSKKVLKETNEYVTTFAYLAFSLPFFLLSLFWLEWASLNFTFWWATLANAVLTLAALIMLMTALKIGELSLTIPFLSFTPVFLIFTSKLILGEMPSLLGIAGILAIVGGAYVLNLKQEKGVAGPFRALLKNRAALLVLLVAFIYAISSNLDKIAVQNSNPITYLIIVMAVRLPILLPFIYFKTEGKFGEIKSKWKVLLPIGLLTALTLFPQMIAYTLTIVPYVISLKRTSALFSVILGFIAFKERNVKPKLLGAALMVAGVFLISMS